MESGLHLLFGRWSASRRISEKLFRYVLNWMLRCIAHDPPRLSPIALRVPLHRAGPAPDHESAGGLLGDRSRECGVGQGERAADRQRLVMQPLRVPSST